MIVYLYYQIIEPINDAKYTWCHMSINCRSEVMNTNTPFKNVFEYEYITVQM